MSMYKQVPHLLALIQIKNLQESPKEIIWHVSAPVFQQCFSLSSSSKVVITSPPNMRLTCKLVQKASGATGNVRQVILCSRPFGSPRECKEGRWATPLCWDTARQSEFRPTNRYLKHAGAGVEAQRTTEFQTSWFSPFFLGSRYRWEGMWSRWVTAY